MQRRGSSDSRATANSHGEVQEVAMRWKCPGSVPAEIEMFFNFNLAREVAGEGQTSR